MAETFRLCYVREPWAYFTTAPLDKQWGDDWNDAPYEHNAGCPYDSYREGEQEIPCKIIQVAYDGELQAPCYHHTNSPYSVERINQGAIPWLSTPSYEKEAVFIHAGVTLEEFRALIAKAGGKVYEANS